MGIIFKLPWFGAPLSAHFFFSIDAWHNDAFFARDFFLKIFDEIF
jgi:hypothetical protein